MHGLCHRHLPRRDARPGRLLDRASATASDHGRLVARRHARRLACRHHLCRLHGRRRASGRRHRQNAGADSPDAQGQALLREDLRTPCTEEVAVFHAFSRIVAEAPSAFVALDTAPTGHTLLLMDATGAYHRQMTRQTALAEFRGPIITPPMRLQDPDYTRVLLVILAETTPVKRDGTMVSGALHAAAGFAWCW